MKTKTKIFIGLLLISLISLVYLFLRAKPSPKPLPSLETAPFSPPPEAIDQAKQDYDFNKIVADELKNAPFLTQLPILTDKYTIIFDFEQNKIRVRLKTGVIRSAVQSEINSQLQKIGADTKKFPVYYLSEPTP